jgi:hypothetical protein
MSATMRSNGRRSFGWSTRNLPTSAHGHTAKDTTGAKRVVLEAQSVKQRHMGLARAVGEMDPQHLSTPDSKCREVIPRLRRDHVRADRFADTSRRRTPAIARERHPLRLRQRLHPSRGRPLLMKTWRCRLRTPRPTCGERPGHCSEHCERHDEQAFHRGSLRRRQLRLVCFPLRVMLER